MSRTLSNSTYYERTKSRFRQGRADSRRRMRAEARAFLVQYKESHPCEDCGKMYPAFVMDFDHLRDKSYNVSEMMGFSTSKIALEIAKCELVCANCHRYRTHGPMAAGMPNQSLKLGH